MLFLFFYALLFLFFSNFLFFLCFYSPSLAFSPLSLLSLNSLMESSSTSLVFSSDSLKRRSGDKARRKQATTEDMLFTNGNEGNEVEISAPVIVTRASEMPSVLGHGKNSTGIDPRMTISLEGGLGTMSEEIQLPPPVSLSTSSLSLKGVPRVVSAPNTLK